MSYIPGQIFGENSSTGASEKIWKDAFTGALVQIEIPHAAIHLGVYFSHSGKITVANGNSYDHLMITPSSPSGKWIHLRLFVIATTSAPVYHYLYEDTTVSSNGSVQTGYNFNRTAANGTLGMYHTPTVTGVGTLIHTAGAIGSKQDGGVGQTSGTEWVLKQGSNYMSRITNSSGASADVTYTAEWYEL